MYPHRLFQFGSIPLYIAFAWGWYSRAQNVKAAIPEDHLTARAIEIAAFVFGIGYALWLLFHQRPKTFCDMRTWRADVQMIAFEAMHLRERFSRLKTEFGSDPFFNSLNTTDLYAANNPKCTAKDQALLDWKNALDDHRNRLHAVTGNYHWWSHFNVSETPSFLFAGWHRE